VKRIASGCRSFKDARIPNRTCIIVPGVADETGPAPDVMRGEETQLLGCCIALQELLKEDYDEDETRVMILPGTHSKWTLTLTLTLVTLVAFFQVHILNGVS